MRKILVGEDRIPRPEDLEDVNKIISVIDGFQVDISVLKAVDMINICRQLENRKGLDSGIANRLKELRSKWKQQVNYYILLYLILFLNIIIHL